MRTQPPHHFEVQGPRRDYDITTFCEEHATEAMDCAAEWLQEVADGCDIDDEVSVTFRVCAGKVDRCYECCPTQPEEEP